MNKIITDAQLRKIVKETVSDKDVSCGLGLVLRIRGAKQTWRVSFVITDPNLKVVFYALKSLS